MGESISHSHKTKLVWRDEATGYAVTRFSGESLNSHPDSETLPGCDPTHLGLVPPDVEGATETLTPWGDHVRQSSAGCVG